MRLVVILAIAVLLSGCTAMLLGNGSQGAPLPDRSATGLSADVSTTTAVRDRFDADEMLSSYSIGVSTYRGRVTLTGSVKDYDVRNRAGQLARGVSGVISVDNRIRVPPVN